MNFKMIFLSLSILTGTASAACPSQPAQVIKTGIEFIKKSDLVGLKNHLTECPVDRNNPAFDFHYLYKYSIQRREDVIRKYLDSLELGPRNTTEVNERRYDGNYYDQAIRYGTPSAIQDMEALGGKMDEFDVEDGLTELMVAAWDNRADSVEYFLKKRSTKINAVSRGSGKTALNYAVSFNKSEEVIKLLLKYGASVTAGWPRGEMEKWIASERSDELIQIMMNKGLSFTERNLNGVNLLLFTTGFCNTDLAVMKLAVKHVRDINTISPKDGETALMLASRCSKRDSIEFLVNAGADRSLKDHNGKTACEYAKKPEVLEVLGDCKTP